MGRKQPESGTKHYSRVPEITIKPRTKIQALLLKSIRDNIITFAIGSAGGGKTFLAVSYALKMLAAKEIDKIVVVRPAVESGEKLGALPGGIHEKLEPYLQPVYSAIKKHLGPFAVNQMLGDGRLEISPLAFMRGITHENCFVILDEAQNCTDEQMEMFLTRIGEDTKYVICGDVTQNDLKYDQRPGLLPAANMLKDLPGIGFCLFEPEDSVRHPIIPRILEKYEEYKAGKKEKKT